MVRCQLDNNLHQDSSKFEQLFFSLFIFSILYTNGIPFHTRPRLYRTYHSIWNSVPFPTHKPDRFTTKVLLYSQCYDPKLQNHTNGPIIQVKLGDRIAGPASAPEGRLNDQPMANIDPNNNLNQF